MMIASVTSIHAMVITQEKLPIKSRIFNSPKLDNRFMIEGGFGGGRPGGNPPLLCRFCVRSSSNTVLPETLIGGKGGESGGSGGYTMGRLPNSIHICL